MARGTQLIQLVEMLKMETGKSVRAGVSTDELPSLKHILRRTQERLYDDYNWPHMKIRPTIELAAGQRYYDTPTTLNYERLEGCYVWHNDKPQPVDRGIGMENYAAHNSHDDERNDPVRAWDMVWVDSPTVGVAREMIEVWPIPETNDDHLQFEGTRKLRDLISNDDVADLDDQLIVLYCAAEILARGKFQDAQAKAGLAQARLNKLLGRTTGTRVTYATMGLGTAGATPRERIRAKYNPLAGA